MQNTNNLSLYDTFPKIKPLQAHAYVKQALSFSKCL